METIANEAVYHVGTAKTGTGKFGKLGLDVGLFGRWSRLLWGVAILLPVAVVLRIGWRLFPGDRSRIRFGLQVIWGAIFCQSESLGQHGRFRRPRLRGGLVGAFVSTANRPCLALSSAFGHVGVHRNFLHTPVENTVRWVRSGRAAHSSLQAPPYNLLWMLSRRWWWIESWLRWDDRKRWKQIR